MKAYTIFSLLFFTVFIMGAGAGSAAAFDKIHTLTPEHPAAYKIDINAGQVAEGAEKFITSMTQRGIAFLADEEMSDEQRRREFKKLLNDSFDMNTIARFSLGRYWRTASKQQRSEYMALFKNMIIEVYSNRFSEYQGQELMVKGARPQGSADTIVTSHIIPESGPEIQVDWRVRHKNGRYKVIDIIVEGVSMAVTQRSDFASVIQRGGGEVNVLLAHLRKE